MFNAFAGWSFASSHLLYLVLLVPLAAWWRARNVAKSGAGVRFSSGAALAGLPTTLRQRLLWVPPAARALALVLIIVAMARPQFGFSSESVQSLGLDIALAVDLSDSMKETDLPPNRLAVAKETMLQFVQKRPSDNFALIGYADVAALLCPLTPEYDILAQFIDRLNFGVLGSSTALGDGLALAVRQLDRSDAKSKVVVLLTDGQNTSGQLDPLKAAELAAALEVRVYTIGIGSEVASQSWFNLSAMQQFDPETLKKIASMTGGRYFHATDANTFAEIFKEIDTLERTRRERVVNRDFNEQMALALWPAFFLLLAEFLLARTYLRRLP